MVTHCASRAAGVIALLLALLLALAAFPSAGMGAERPAPVDPILVRLATDAPSARVRVIVQTDGGADDAVRAAGGTIGRRLQGGRTLAAELPGAAVPALARDPRVRRVAVDAPIRFHADSSTTRFDPGQLATLYPRLVEASDLWTAAAPITGKGVGVALIDSGTAAHPALKRVQRVTVHPGLPMDDRLGHGTHLAGIIAGQDVRSGGHYVGVAPEADLISVQVTDSQGTALTSDVIAGIEWVIANKDSYRIRVLSLSLTSALAEDYRTSPLNAAVELAWLRGIVVVAAAGNRGAGDINHAPANDPYVITVGGTDTHDTLDLSAHEVLPYSSYGQTSAGHPKPDLVAPGRRIVAPLARGSIYQQLYPDRIVEQQYLRLSGTSESTAIVSGVVAQMLQARPDLCPDQVKWLLQQTARPIGPTATGAQPVPGAGAGYPSGTRALAYTGTVERANRGVTPNWYLAAAYVRTTTSSTSTSAVSWDAVSWDAVSWDAVSWDAVSWDAVSWDAVSWDAVSWDAVSWDAVSWDAVSWDAVSWDSAPAD
ncbi:MAG: S8 family serine peptidase [Chloroflexi bacterium]|nr:S8 family serine peptidase [Chloroflexota bacterium]